EGNVSRRYDRAAPKADGNAGWGGERSWQSRTGFAGRQRTGKAACRLRCEGGALSGGRRRVAVGAGEGPGGWLDARSGGCVGHCLWHAVRLHDFRSIWSQSGAEQGYPVSEPLAIVEFELAWAPHLLSTMDYTYRERHGEAIYRFKSLPCEGGMLPSDFFLRNVVLSFQEDAIGIRLRDVIGPRQHDVGQHDVGQHDVGLGLSAERVDVSPIAQDPGGDPGRSAVGRTGQACPGPRSAARRRQHPPR